MNWDIIYNTLGQIFKVSIIVMVFLGTIIFAIEAIWNINLGVKLKKAYVATVGLILLVLFLMLIIIIIQ